MRAFFVSSESDMYPTFLPLSYLAWYHVTIDRVTRRFDCSWKKFSSLICWTVLKEHRHIFTFYIISSQWNGPYVEIWPQGKQGTSDGRLPWRVKWGLWCQEQVSQAGISNHILQYSVECNYLSMPEIAAYGTKVLKSKWEFSGALPKVNQVWRVP